MMDPLEVTKHYKKREVSGSNKIWEKFCNAPLLNVRVKSVFWEHSHNKLLKNKKQKQTKQKLGDLSLFISEHLLCKHAH